MKNAAKLILNKLPQLKVSLNSLLKQDLLVGVPSDKTDRKSSPDEKEGMNNATLAYIFEHGSPAANIPARPAIQMGIEAGKEKVVAQLKKAAQAVIKDNNETAVEAGFIKAGLIAQASIRNQIVAGIPPSLAPATLAARRRRGRQGTTPLLDTAQYRNSINFVVRNRTK